MADNLVTAEAARNLAYACGKSRYEYYGCGAKAAAQRNLAGRSHYVDDDTLRFFHARILNARPVAQGLILCLIESVAGDINNRSRGFRFVAFDIFGTVVTDHSNLDDLLRTGDKAHQAADSWLESFDVAAHYRAAIGKRAERLDREAAALREAATAWL
jgi:hypothetical protein